MLMKKDVVRRDKCIGPKVYFQSERRSLRGTLQWMLYCGCSELLPSTLALLRSTDGVIYRWKHYLDKKKQGKAICKMMVLCVFNVQCCICLVHWGWGSCFIFRPEDYLLVGQIFVCSSEISVKYPVTFPHPKFLSASLCSITHWKVDRNSRHWLNKTLTTGSKCNDST